MFERPFAYRGMSPLVASLLSAPFPEYDRKRRDKFRIQRNEAAVILSRRRNGIAQVKIDGYEEPTKYLITPPHPPPPPPPPPPASDSKVDTKRWCTSLMQPECS